MTRKSNIRIEYHHPPIPWRAFDYCATFDDYEPGDAVGHGATGEAAVEDLLMQEEGGRP